MRENVSMAHGSLDEIFARVERRFARADRAFRSLLTTRAEQKIDALEDLLVHGRAVTNVMQTCRHVLAGFDDWYQPHASKLKQDAGLRRLYQMRSEVLKQGRLSVTQAAVVFRASEWPPLPPPDNAVGFIPYDLETGKAAWVVRREDGTEERDAVDLPPGAEVSEYFLFQPSLRNTQDLRVEMTANRFISYLRLMVDELRVLVIRARKST